MGNKRGEYRANENCTLFFVLLGILFLETGTSKISNIFFLDN